MSKIESGKCDLVSQKVYLPDLIKSVTDMCQPLIAEKQHEFQISIGMVRHEYILTDGDRLKQVLINLLSNAIKYTPAHGSITLQIHESRNSTLTRRQYEFICSDTGVGIEKEWIPLVFKPFWRAEDPRISKIQGTGLGMTITENIVHMMNGEIGLKSEVGKGSTFTVSIPFEAYTDEDINTQEFEDLSILIVDDDQITCESAAMMLNEMGIRSRWVLSGHEAIQCILDAHDQNDDYFAVILDLKMPDMDGLETVKAIRKKLGDTAPIIVFSAYDFGSIEGEFLRAGADALISKPLFKSKILQVLHLFLDKESETTGQQENENRMTWLEGRRLLLVDDNELNREVTVEILKIQANNIEIEDVDNGKKALAAFKASDIGYYDAILMDIQMPVMNGYEATLAIRALDREDAKTVPIIALTADAFDRDVVKAHDAGMNAHVSKPVDLKRLIDTLGCWLRK